MPTVPDVDARVQAGVAPDVRINVRATPASFGGQTGRAVTALGGQAGNVAAQLRAEEERAEAEARRTLLAEKEAQYKHRLQQLMFDENTGYMHRELQDAHDQFVPTRDALFSAGDEIEETLANDEDLQNRFKFFRITMEDYFDRHAGEHLNTQVDKWKDNVDASNLQLEHDLARNAYRDITGVEDRLANQDVIIDLQGERKSLSPETVEAQKNALRKSQYTANIRQAGALDDTIHMESMLDNPDIVKHLDPKTIEWARNRINNESSLAAAVNEVNALIGAPDLKANFDEWLHNKDLGEFEFRKLEQELVKAHPDGVGLGTAQNVLREQWARLKMQKQKNGKDFIDRTDAAANDRTQIGSAEGQIAVYERAKIDDPDNAGVYDDRIEQIQKRRVSLNTTSTGQRTTQGTTMQKQDVKTVLTLRKNETEDTYKRAIDNDRDDLGNYTGKYAGRDGAALLRQELTLLGFTGSEADQIVNHRERPVLKPADLDEAYFRATGETLPKDPNSKERRKWMKRLASSAARLGREDDTVGELTKQIEFLTKYELVRWGPVPNVVAGELLDAAIAKREEDTRFSTFLPEIGPGDREWNETLEFIEDNPNLQRELNVIDGKHGKDSPDYAEFVQITFRMKSRFPVQRRRDLLTTADINEATGETITAFDAQEENRINNELQIAKILEMAQEAVAQRQEFEIGMAGMKLSVESLASRIAREERNGNIIIPKLKQELEDALESDRLDNEVPKWFQETIEEGLGPGGWERYNAMVNEGASLGHFGFPPSDAYKQKIRIDALDILKAAIDLNKVTGE